MMWLMWKPYKINIYKYTTIVTDFIKVSAHVSQVKTIQEYG